MPGWMRPATLAWSAVVLGAVAVVTVSGNSSPVTLVPYVVAAVTAVWVLILVVVSSRERRAPVGEPGQVAATSQLARLDAIPQSLTGRAHHRWEVEVQGVPVQRGVGEPPDPDEAAAIASALRRPLLVGRAVAERSRV